MIWVPVWVPALGPRLGSRFGSRLGSQFGSPLWSLFGSPVWISVWASRCGAWYMIYTGFLLSSRQFPPQRILRIAPTYFRAAEACACANAEASGYSYNCYVFQKTYLILFWIWVPVWVPSIWVRAGACDNCFRSPPLYKDSRS